MSDSHVSTLRPVVLRPDLGNFASQDFYISARSFCGSFAENRRDCHSSSVKKTTYIAEIRGDDETMRAACEYEFVKCALTKTLQREGETAEIAFAILHSPSETNH